MAFIDRNAADSKRLRRDMQRMRNGDITSSIKMTAPLKGGNSLSLTLAAAGGLQVVSSALTLKLADTSLVLSAAGEAVNLAANSGLQTSSGLLLKLADTSLSLGVGGVNVHLATNPGLQVSSGLLLKLTDTSLALGAGGVGVNLATNSGLQISSGVLLHLADASLVLGASGVSVNLVTSNPGLKTTPGGIVLNLDSTGSNLTVGTGGLKMTAQPTFTKVTLQEATVSNARYVAAFNAVELAEFSHYTDSTGPANSNRNGTYMYNISSGFFLQIDSAGGSLVYGPAGLGHVFAVYTTGTLEVAGQAGLTDSFATGDGRTATFTGGILTGLA